jgi:hypothetical protein
VRVERDPERVFRFALVSYICPESEEIPIVFCAIFVSFVATLPESEAICPVAVARLVLVVERARIAASICD